MFRPDPSVIPLPAYQEAIQAHAKYQADLGAAFDEVERLRGAALGARLADNAASATALLEGTKDPGPLNEKRNTTALEAAVRKVGVLEQAVGQADAAIDALLQERTEDLKAAAVAGIAAARERYVEAIDALEAARYDFHAAGALEGWLDDPHRRFKASQPLLKVRGLVTQNGEPTPLDPILETLRDEAHPPAPARVVTRWKPVTEWEPSAVEGIPLGQTVSMVPVFADSPQEG